MREFDDDELHRELSRIGDQRYASYRDDSAFLRRVHRSVRWRSCLGSLCILAAVALVFVIDRRPAIDSVDPIAGRAFTPIELSPMPRSVAHLEASIERDLERVEQLAAAPDAKPEAIADAHARLDLRELAARDGIDAAPAFFDVLERSDSASMRAEAATLLSVVGHPDAFEEIYHEIVRMIDSREPTLRELLTAATHALKRLRGEAAPRWSYGLGGEMQSFVLTDSDAREPALRLLFELQRVTGASYSATGFSVLRSGIEGPGTQSAFRLLSDDDIVSRADELMAICRRLFSSDSRADALRFLQRAHRLQDYSPLGDDILRVASSDSFALQERKLAALTLARFDAVHPNEMYARFGLLEEK